MRPWTPSLVLATAALLSACAGLAPGQPAQPTKPAAWAAPEVLVPPSHFTGVHGLAIDRQGRLLAGSVVGNAIWEVDRQTGAAKILIGGPEGQADDIAIGPNGELAWTNYLAGQVRVREREGTPMKVVAQGLPGINSLDYDRRNGKLYASQVFLGDAVWELDPSGTAPPRLIAKDLGGFNGFEVGPDGQLYGPLWFKRSVVKLDPATGAVTVINSSFQTPAAANLDGRGHLWVVDTATGELARITLATGAKAKVAQLSSALDNLAIAPDGTVYVSNMADNAIQAVDPATGAVQTLTRGAVAVPAGLKRDGDSLLLADVFAYRRIDLATGRVTDLKRMQASDLEYPFSVGVGMGEKGDGRVALASWFTGSVQVLNRRTQATEAVVHGFTAPYDALPLADGSLLVAELGTGSLVQASGPGYAQRRTVASGLQGPVQMVLAPGSDAVYLSEAAGNVLRIALADGARSVLASGLALPEGLALTPWGSLVVAESAAARLTEIDLAQPGQRRVLAERLPIGLSGGPGMPPPYVPTGVAVGPDGSVYFSADRNNAVYRVRPQR